MTFEQALELFDCCDVIALDTETNGGDIRDGTGWLNGISLAGRLPGIGVKSTYLPFRHIPLPNGSSGNLSLVDLARLRNKIENYKGTIVFHNAKFDLESLRTIGINYTGKYYCTMLMVHLINENLWAKDLNTCCRFYLKTESKKESESFKKFLAAYGWAGMLTGIIFEYAAHDAYITLLLFEEIKSKFDAEELEEYWLEHKTKFSAVIRAMERRGINVDTALCNRMTVHGEMAMDDIVALLDERNPGSSKVLNKLLIEELGLPVVKRSKKTNEPSFDKEAMAQYDEILERVDSPIAEYILSYRGWQKSVSSNYKPYVELLSPDGRLRCNYKLHGTKTGRMSCEKPNLQQIPRSGEKPWNGTMKKAFIPAPGYRLWEADYSQLELRLATAYADESELKQIFLEGRDVFTEMSTALGMLRHDVKTLVYTIQYGGGINRISNVFRVSPDRAAELREEFYVKYPGFKLMAQMAQRKATANRKLKLWSGRYRHFQFPKEEGHKAFNSVIQGGAADIVERTMIRLFDQVDNEEECRMLLQVHDSIVFEIKEGLEDKYHPLIKQTMENVEPDFGVKFAVDIHEWGVAA